MGDLSRRTLWVNWAEIDEYLEELLLGNYCIYSFEVPSFNYVNEVYHRMQRSNKVTVGEEYHGFYSIEENWGIRVLCPFTVQIVKIEKSDILDQIL